MSNNKMLIDATHPEETRVVVLRGGRVEEFDYESAARKLLRGNIYLAKVTRVEPSLQAAFVDYGGNRHGFLAFNEIHPDYYQIPVADRQALLDEEAAAEAEEEAAADARAEAMARRRAQREQARGQPRRAEGAEGDEGFDAGEEEPYEVRPHGEDDDNGRYAEEEGEGRSRQQQRRGRRGRNRRGRDRGGERGGERAEFAGRQERNGDRGQPRRHEDDEQSADTQRFAAGHEDEAGEARHGHESESGEGHHDHDHHHDHDRDHDHGHHHDHDHEHGHALGHADHDTSHEHAHAAAEPHDHDHDHGHDDEHAHRERHEDRHEDHARHAPAGEEPASADTEHGSPSRTVSEARGLSDERRSEIVAVSDAPRADDERSAEEADDEAGDDAGGQRVASDDAVPAARGNVEDEGVSEVNGNGEAAEVDQVGSEDALEELPSRPRRRPRSYKIQEVIKRRQIILVQVVKEERGNKGAALTTYLSLAGRYTVLMPNTARGGGISRKITQPQDRKRLKAIAASLEVPEGMGLIIRTAGASRTAQEIKRDFEYLLRLWESVRDLTLQSVAPSLVYEEGNLIKRSIRDLYNKDIDEVIVAGHGAHAEAHDFMRMLMPSHAKNVVNYREPEPLFTRFQIERQLNAMFSPYVTLRSGGYLVINQTEALVAIDVNSGRSTREFSIEETALNTNLEAAEEIARQLKLRDLAGLIVIDFIDMEERRNNRRVENRLKDALRFDRARIQVGRISHFGLMEMSRQRLRTGVLEGSTAQCAHCQGTGIIRSTESVALAVLRGLEDAIMGGARTSLVATTTPTVALYILNNKRPFIIDMERRTGLPIVVQGSDKMQGANFTVEKGAAPVQSARRPERAAVNMDWGFEGEDDAEGDVDSEIGMADPGIDVDGDAEPRARDGERSREGERNGGNGDDAGRRGRRRRRRRGRRGERGEGDQPMQTLDDMSDDSADDGRDDEAREDADAPRERAGEDYGDDQGVVVEHDFAQRDANGDGEDEDVSAEAEHGEAGETAGDGRDGARKRGRRRGRRGGRRGRDRQGEATSGESTDEASPLHVETDERSGHVAATRHAPSRHDDYAAERSAPIAEQAARKAAEAAQGDNRPARAGEPEQGMTQQMQPKPAAAAAEAMVAASEVAEQAASPQPAPSEPAPAEPAPRRSSVSSEPRIERVVVRPDAATPQTQEVTPAAAEPRRGWWSRKLLG